MTAKAYRKDRSTRRHHLMMLGLWHPWHDDYEKVRQHVVNLHDAGATWADIAARAGLSKMTVWRLVHENERTRTEVGNKLLAISIADLTPKKVPAREAMWRLRSLMAMGHWCKRLAAGLNVNVTTIYDVIDGSQEVVSIKLHLAVRELWLKWWDKRPECRDKKERGDATKARNRARDSKWPTPANLDEEMLQDPDYRPTARWIEAMGTGVVR